MSEYNKTTQKIINFDYVTKKSIKDHNSKWLLIPNHPYTILITEDSGSEKTSSLFNSISHQPDIDKT